MTTRLVVTGHDSRGHSVFARDEIVEPISVALLPGTEFYPLWGADQARSFPDDGSKPSAIQYFPSLGGFRFGIVKLAPDSTSTPQALGRQAAIQEVNAKLPGLGDVLEPDQTGMHTTATIDYVHIVSGRCVLELDGGATRKLGPGDTVIQNGTRHTWHNPYDEYCVLAFTLIGAEHRGLPGK